PAFRSQQVYDWLFNRRAGDFQAMTNLPAGLRDALQSRYRLHPLSVRHKAVSRLDGTIRFFFASHDGAEISTVYLPEAERLSLCLSTQVGCAYRCSFCASGLAPFRRQLSAAEIVDQILLIGKDQDRMPTNLLFMGMGEPLANYTQVMTAIRWITAAHGIGMSPSRITLSTSGLVPQIVKMADEGVKVKLAISLHAVRDDLRLKIMPVSGRFGVRDLIKAARYYARRSQSAVTFEYILLNGVNDHLVDANRLSYLVKGFTNKVNLIPYNPVPNLPYERPTNESIFRFQSWLRERGVPVFIRKPKGLDIGSACGQLGSSSSQ
ncbi:MAG TPA: 23S rRNA (adenine(2503)-C(2))-methyltransferase RlmN, partial [Elusimicrobiota bacterium]|nr:23S rRNA (adenine(2503)-C(2))-methyltransferase RlmN [Elusimicrobiota bacterium]